MATTTETTYQTRIIGLKGHYRVRVIRRLTNTAVVEILHNENLDHRFFLAKLDDLK